MAKTRHMHKRMNQRAITKRMIGLVNDFGVRKGDKRILDRKNIDQLVDSMTELKKDLLKLRDKGGLVVVEVDNVQLTTYKLDSYDRRRIS